MDFGSKTRGLILILLVLITCTCSGLKLMLGSQNSESQIEFSSFFGKRAKPIQGLMVCAILRTDALGLVTCLQERQCMRLPLVRIHGSEYCPNLEPMLKKCLQIKSYPSPTITPFSSSQYKTEWINQKQSSHIEYLQANLPGKALSGTTGNTLQDLIPLSIGETLGTTLMMGKNYSYWYMMNQASGKSQTTSLTIGE